jgi:hypothetical protein
LAFSLFPRPIGRGPIEAIKLVRSNAAARTWRALDFRDQLVAAPLKLEALPVLYVKRLAHYFRDQLVAAPLKRCGSSLATPKVSIEEFPRPIGRGPIEATPAGIHVAAASSRRQRISATNWSRPH